MDYLLKLFTSEKTLKDTKKISSI